MNAAVVQEAKVTIEAIDGQLTALEQKIWNQTHFGRIETSYFGPTAEYDYDLLFLWYEKTGKMVWQEF